MFSQPCTAFLLGSRRRETVLGLRSELGKANNLLYIQRKLTRNIEEARLMSSSRR